MSRFLTPASVLFAIGIFFLIVSGAILQAGYVALCVAFGIASASCLIAALTKSDIDDRYY